MRSIVFVLSMLVLIACGAPQTSSSTAPASASPTDIANVAAASPSTVSTVLPEVLPTSTASMAASVTATTITATVTPPATAEVRATATAVPIPTARPAQAYRIIPTDDGFVTVRAEPKSTSAAVTRLKPGALVDCVGFVKGEALFGTNQWADCPSIGGYILSVLLVDANAPTPAPVVNNDDEIVAAVHKYLAEPGSPIQRGARYKISNICVDRGYALAMIDPVNTIGERMVVLLKRSNGSWRGIFSGPGMALYSPSASEEFGFPADFKCLNQ